MLFKYISKQAIEKIGARYEVSACTYENVFIWLDKLLYNILIPSTSNKKSRPNENMASIEEAQAS